MTMKNRTIIDKATMERLVALSETDPVAGFVEMWRVLEPTVTDDGPDGTFAPWDYTLLPAQSKRLVEAGLEGCRHQGIDTWTIMGLWLNNGPSTEQL